MQSCLDQAGEVAPGEKAIHGLAHRQYGRMTRFAPLSLPCGLAGQDRRMREVLARQPVVGEVHGEGLLCAIELVEDRDARRFFDPAKTVGPRVAAALLKRGVIGRAMPQGDILGFAPPLCLTREEADAIVMTTRDAIEEAAATIRR